MAKLEPASEKDDAFAAAMQRLIDAFPDKAFLLMVVSQEEAQVQVELRGNMHPDAFEDLFDLVLSNVDTDTVEFHPSPVLN